MALTDAKAFQQLSRTRSRCQSTYFSLSFEKSVPACSSGEPSVSGQTGLIALGFVLPKKLLKRAVDRNQIKRWTRGLLRGLGCSENLQVVVRPKTSLNLRDVLAREEIRTDLAALVRVWGDRLAHAA